MTTSVSKTIYASRDAIRTQVIDFLQQYMELNEVDLTQSSFLSYIIDILTTLSSNLMFYQSNIYREFFLTQAQLPESIHNLSSFLGYSPKEAKYATASVLMKVWLPFSDNNTKFNIPKDFEFKTSDGTIFVTYYKTTVTVERTDEYTSISIIAEEEGRIYNIQHIINMETEPYYFQFMLSVRQYKTKKIETGIDDDILPFQFINKFIEISGKVAEIDVYIKEEEDTSDNGVPYTQFNSLYLMTSSDYGYVLRSAAGGRTLYFGNGIIGIQPKAGSTIIVYIKETLGNDGNVIAGSITQGQRIYTQQNNQTAIVDYEVINPSPAFGGENEENLQEIRSNSIKSLVSLGRLVSEQDYKNFDVVIPNAPVKSNSIPVLKRSDLKINEIQLYTIFKFGDTIVPSKNITYEIESEETFIPRNTVIIKDQVDYITLFEMAIDSMNNAAYYQYSMTSIQIVPILGKSWSLNNTNLYNFSATNSSIINNNDGTATVNLYYYSSEPDFYFCTCLLRIASINKNYAMINIPDLENKIGYFSYTFPDHLEIPTGNDSFYFVVSNLYTPPAEITDPDNPGQTIPNPNPDPLMVNLCEYYISFTYRKNLKSFMISNTIIDNDTGKTIIHDIPVIKKSYFDSIDPEQFELQILQQFLASADFKNYRMLTDFINLKLCNTTGLSINMLRNTPTREPVFDLGLTSIPSTPEIGDKYIVSGNEGGEWNGKRDKITICTQIDPVVWSFSDPKSNDIVYVENKNSIYIFTEYGWIKPIYEIPLQINIEVFKENDSSIGETDLIDSIKTSIIDYYSDLFGPKLILRRSKIIDIIHNTKGVSHCRLITPESDIFFDYNISDFSQKDLLEYSPEWVYFTHNDIHIKPFTVD